MEGGAVWVCGACQSVGIRSCAGGELVPWCAWVRLPVPPKLPAHDRTRARLEPPVRARTRRWTNKRRAAVALEKAFRLVLAIAEHLSSTCSRVSVFPCPRMRCVLLASLELLVTRMVNNDRARWHGCRHRSNRVDEPALPKQVSTEVERALAVASTAVDSTRFRTSAETSINQL